MIPFSSPEFFIGKLRHQEEKEVHWFIFAGDELLVSTDKTEIPSEHSFSLLRSLYIGTLKNKHLFACDVENGSPAPQGWAWIKLKDLHNILNADHYSVAGRALQLVEWDRTHTYCGCCGSLTFQRKEERCKECPSCGHLAYPKIAPAIMALVRKGNQILLARSPHFPEKMYSVLAGFVDPGETLEQCVVREVFEEVGIKVKNVSYFGSQPWPFSRSLMIGFTCDWEEGEICIDPLEIEDAAWFDQDHLPDIPTSLSLARSLIDSMSNS